MKQKKKKENFLSWKCVKITKRSHTAKGYGNTYNVEIWNFFYPELHLKATESATKNKLIDLLSELRGFKFVKALVLEFKIKKIMIKRI